MYQLFVCNDGVRSLSQTVENKTLLVVTSTNLYFVLNTNIFSLQGRITELCDLHHDLNYDGFNFF